MQEAVATQGPERLVDELRVNCFIEGLEHLVTGAAHDLRDEARIEVATDHRCDVEYVAGLSGDSAHALFDRQPHPIRNAERLAAQHGSFEPALGTKQTDDLVDEERVSVGGLVNGARQGWIGRVCTAALDQRQDIFLAETTQRYAPRVARQLTEQRTDLPVMPRLGVAVAADDEQPRLAQVAREEAQEQQRRRIGRMQIVEYQRQRPVPGGATQERAHRIKQRKAQVLGLETRDRGKLGDDLAQLGRDLGDEGGAVAELFSQCLRIAVAK
ncbi:MAG: hypothetical protein M3N04_01030, partial [Actinomycetota bacterium]|nr:hypothetical protein [Actinomycetota bacterium]